MVIAVTHGGVSPTIAGRAATFRELVAQPWRERSMARVFGVDVPDEAVGYLVGQVMKATRGQANAGLAQAAVREQLESTERAEN